MGKKAIFHGPARACSQQDHKTHSAEMVNTRISVHPQTHGGNSYRGSSDDEVEEGFEPSCKEIPTLPDRLIVECEDCDSLTDKGSDPSLPNSPITTKTKRARSHDSLRLKELQAEVSHSSVEQLYEAATILNQMQQFDVHSTDLPEVDALVQDCLKTRLLLWAKHRGVFVESRGDHLSKLIEDERDLIQQHEDMQKWMEQDMQLCPFLFSPPMKKRAKFGKDSVGKSTFVHTPTSAFCAGCVVMVRRDFSIGTIVGERKGGWYIVRFDDGSTGCFQRYELRKLHDAEGTTGERVSHDSIGQVVRINKQSDRSYGVLVAEKNGGWRMVEQEDGTPATYLQDTGLEFVESEASNSESNDAQHTYIDITDAVEESSKPRQMKCKTTQNKQARTRERQSERLESCDNAGSSAASSSACEPFTNGRNDAAAVASLVGMKVWLKQNDEVGTIILEKNGGWKVVLFADGRKQTFRPGELYVPGLPSNFLYAENHSNGPCTLFRQGQQVYVPKHNSQAVIIEEKAGGWRVVKFPDGQVAAFRPGDIEMVSGDRSKPFDTPTSNHSCTDRECCDCDNGIQINSPQYLPTAARIVEEGIEYSDASGDQINSPHLPTAACIEEAGTECISDSGNKINSPLSLTADTAACIRIRDAGTEYQPHPQMLEIVTVKRTRLKGTVVCDKSGGWRVVEFEDQSRLTFRAGDLEFCGHVYGYACKPTLTLARPRSDSACTSSAP